MSDEITTTEHTEQPYHTLRVSSLYKSFGKKKVVQGVDFKMHTGEVLGLLGAGRQLRRKDPGAQRGGQAAVQRGYGENLHDGAWGVTPA